MIDTYLDKMDDLLEEAWNLPFTGGKRMIDIEKMRELIDEVRLNIPHEIKEAKAIVADRKDILEDAQKEAEDIIKKAELKAKQLISDEEIIRTAKEKSSTMLTEAAQKTKEMQRAAVDFSEQRLLECEDALATALSEVKKARSAVRSVK